MTLNYKKLKNFDGSENTGAILKTSPSPEIWIPFDPAKYRLHRVPCLGCRGKHARSRRLN